MTEPATLRYRATIRYGTARKQYLMIDVDAHDAAHALRLVAERVDPAVAAAADIVELRLLADPDTREYGPE